MNGQLQLRDIDNELKNLFEKKMEIKKQIRRERKKRKGKSNTHSRVSNNFFNKLEEINDKRETLGFDKISNPKITELVVRHKLWALIERDLMYFNTSLEEDEYKENEK